MAALSISNALDPRGTGAVRPVQVKAEARALSFYYGSFRALNRLDLWLLTAGMAGVGLQTSLREIMEAGSRPLWVGLIHWVALAALSLLLAKVFCG